MRTLLSRTRWLIAVSAVVLFSPLSQAQLSWNITYDDDGTGSGFDINTTDGATRQATVASALTYLSSQLDARGTVNFTMEASADLGGSTLASAGSTLVGGATANGVFQTGVVFRRAMTNTAPNFADPTPDGTGQFDFINHTWNSTTNPVQSGESDLYSVALHEFTHAIGFFSRIQSTGQGGGSQTLGNPDRYGQLARFMRLGASESDPLLITSSAAFNTAEITNPSGAVTSDNVYFHGTFAKAANGGNAIQIFAPNPFKSGSSMSHVNDTFTNAVMSPSLTEGTQIRTFQNFEIGMLIDIGWNQYFWSGSNGNWGDHESDITGSPWQNFEQAKGTYSSNVTTTLSPVGNITTNMVLTFQGSSAYTSTNNLNGASDAFLVNRIVLENTSTSGTSVIAAANSRVLKFGTTIGVTPRIEQNGTGAFEISHAIQLTAAGLELAGNGTGKVTISGNISEETGANASITRIGSAEFELTGANTFTGDTTISDGTLRVNNASGSATGTGDVTINGTGTLAGGGTITGDVAITDGGTVAPGNSTGTLTVGNTTFGPAGSYDFEINDATGTAGSTINGWDLLQGTSGSTLDITATSGNPFTINIISLTLAQVPGEAANFDSNTEFVWDIASFDGGITGFNANAFTLNTSAFVNGTGAGHFELQLNGTNDILQLRFNPVPEPSLMIGLGALTIGGIGYIRRRRTTETPAVSA